MKTQKDIGKIVGDKLATSNYSARPSLWEDINKTLDKKKRRKKFFLFSGLALLTVTTVGAFYVMSENASNNTNETSNGSGITSKEFSEGNDASSNDLNTDETSKNKRTNPSDSIYTIKISTAIEAAYENADEISNSSSIATKNNNTTASNSTETNVDDLKNSTNTTKNTAAKPNTSQKKEGVASKNKKFSDAMEADGFEKTTTYHYYNSEDSTTISTENKSEFDTLLKEKGIIKDVKRDSTTIKSTKDTIN